MADLSAFATKDNADEGVIFPVKIDGTKLPIALKIFGSDSDGVKDYERAKMYKAKKYSTIAFWRMGQEDVAVWEWIGNKTSGTKQLGVEE